MLLLLISHGSHAQKKGSIITRCNPSLITYISSVDSTKDYLRDSCSQKFYFWRNGKFNETKFAKDGINGVDGLDGLDGRDGVNGIAATVSVISTTTTAPGTQANVTNTGSASQAQLNFFIPRGADGLSGGGALPGYSPEQFLAKHSNQTISASDLGKFPGIGATTSDTYDWGAIQMCFQQLGSKSGSIFLQGDYYVNRSIATPKYGKRIGVHGNYSQIITTNSNTFTVIATPQPTDNADANVMIANAALYMFGIDFSLQGSQTAIEAKCYFEFYGEQIRVWNGAENIHLRFCLNSELRHCYATNSVNGWIADVGNWTGWQPYNSQSNHTTFEHCRMFAPTNGNIGFGLYYASGIRIEDCIIEGKQVNKAIDVNAQTTVVKNMEIKNTHFECESGAVVAFLYSRSYDLNIVIDAPFGQYAAILADVASTTGLGNVQIKNCKYWVAKNGKAFVNSQNSWEFDLCEAFNPKSINIPSLFSGTVPSLYSGGNGYNQYSVQQIPR